MSLKAPYLLALCEAAPQGELGAATRLGTQTSPSNLDAARLIHSIVKFSPSAESVAIEFLGELRKSSRLHQLVESVLSGEAELPDTQQWTQEVLDALNGLTARQRSLQLNSVVDLASEYLSHLLLDVRNPGGKKTPQVSVLPTPGIVEDLTRIRGLIDLAATHRDQSALKKLIFARDGYQCPLTDYSFDPTIPSIVPRCAHILPFSLRGKAASLRLIQTFTGAVPSAATVLENINLPRNAFNIQNDAHDSFDALQWGIEAIQADGQTTYRFRQVGRACATINRADGDVITFNGGTSGTMIDGPDPAFCNLHLAIARVFHASGAADIIAEVYTDDDDDFVGQPIYFGGSISDEVLYQRLDDRLISYT